MKIPRNILKLCLFFLLITISTTISINAQTSSIEMEILKHGSAIRKAFKAGDVEMIKLLHHPEVVKALNYNEIRTGRAQIIAGVELVLKNYTLEFIHNDIENILIKGDIAIEQTKFSIQGIPKNEGESFVFSGRTMVTYMLYEKSPTGWATIREIIQIATE